MRVLLESRLSEESGISRAELREFRIKKLEEGVHYTRGKQGIAYTKIGEKALKKYFPALFEEAVEPKPSDPGFAEACGIYPEDLAEAFGEKKETPPLMLTDGLDRAAQAAKEEPSDPGFAEACGIYPEDLAEAFGEKKETPPLMLTDGLDRAAQAAKEEPETMELRVVSMPKNTRILYCEDAMGKSVLVHVRSNLLFTQGMAVKARRLGARIEYYGKYPRRKGVM